MVPIIIPAMWLIVFIVGLPLLSETVYTPSLPAISKFFNVSESVAEHTLTIYLFAFALGTLFWGKISDHIGRKPSVLMGMLLFILGCIGCYFLSTIDMLMISRFVQAFGGSVGSVLGQAICRDAFHGPNLGKAYSIMGASISLFPAVGPTVGGFIAQHYGWKNIFIFLTVVTIALLICLWHYLPETYPFANRVHTPVKKVAYALITDIRVVGCTLIIGAYNGIGFSYFAEGSFYLIALLGLSPQQYGMSFMPIAAAGMMGGLTSKYLHNYYNSERIMWYGIRISFVCMMIFAAVILMHTYVYTLPVYALIGLTICVQIAARFGVSMITSNTLALALQDYKWCVGTASSLFGFFYYIIISCITFGMGWLHNGTLLPMPLYFLCINLCMLLVYKTMIARK